MAFGACWFLTSAVAQKTILYYSSYNTGTDNFGVALAGIGADYKVTLAGSVNNFTALLSTGAYDVGVFLEQGGLHSEFDFDAAFDALDAQILAGRGAIASDYSMNNAHADGFGATFTNNVNMTSVSISEPLYSSGVTSPLLLKPAFAIYSTGLQPTTGVSSGEFITEINPELDPDLTPPPDSALVTGNGGRSVFLGFLSDSVMDSPQGQQLFTNITVAVASRINHVPEPGAMVLSLAGLLAMGTRRSR